MTTALIWMKLARGYNEQRKDATMKPMFILLTTLFSSISQASVYSCKVTEEYEVSNAGELVRADHKIYRNHQFHIDKRTGVISSEKLIITNDTALTRRTVIDMGGTENSYKLISLTDTFGEPRGTNVDYITVLEHRKSPEKPFTMLYQTRILSGVCN